MEETSLRRQSEFMSLPYPNGLLERLRNGKRSWSWPLRIAAVVGFLVTVYLIVSYNPTIRVGPRPYGAHLKESAHNLMKQLPYNHALESHIAHLESIQKWQAPVGMRVIGLVFYGRRRFVSILNCYLQVYFACAVEVRCFRTLTALVAKLGGEWWDHSGIYLCGQDRGQGRSCVSRRASCFKSQIFCPTQYRSRIIRLQSYVECCRER